jgi:predicted metal-binding membrane protein
VNAGASPDRIPLSLREAAPAWTAIVALTVLAWIVTLDQVRAMGNGAGTMGMSFVEFVAMWTAMMAAMMFPSMAPVAIFWTHSVVSRSSSAVASYRITLFVTGYLLAWAFAGVLAFFGLALFEQVRRAKVRRAPRPVCCTASSLVFLGSMSDLLSYRTHWPFDFKVVTLPKPEGPPDR